MRATKKEKELKGKEPLLYLQNPETLTLQEISEAVNLSVSLFAALW